MTSKKLLNGVMQELELDEARKVNGGGGYLTARGLACFYQVVMGMKFSCSADWFALNPSGVTTGGGMCTHR